MKAIHGKCIILHFGPFLRHLQDYMETVGKNLVSAMPEKNFKGKALHPKGKYKYMQAKNIVRVKSLCLLFCSITE